MTTIAKLLVELDVDSQGLKSGLNQAERQTKTASKSIGSSMASNVAAFTAVAAGAVVVGKAIWDVTQRASDLEESINKVDVVFGNSAQEIQDWSMDTANSMGISRQAALEAVGTYGNLFTSLGLTQDAASDMSRSLVGLAADMASFNNANPEDVLMALRSGLSGEIEPLKKFGIAMNEVILKQKAMELGLGDNIQALTEAQKIQVRYAVIMEQTANAQGDFARTSDGLANTQRILKANFQDLKAIVGEAFLPDITESATAVKDLTVWIKDNIDAIQKWGNVLGWVVAFPVKLSGAIADWRRGMDGTATSIETAKRKAEDLVPAIEGLPPAFDEAADSSKNLEDALKAQSAVFKSILSGMNSIQSASDQYTDTIASNEERLQEIAEEKVRLQIEQNAVQAAGDLTLARRNEFVKQQIALDQEANDIAADSINAAKQKEDAAKKLTYQLLEQKAAQDGIINPEEFKFLQDTAVTMGLVDRESANAAIAASDAADEIWSAFAAPTERVKSLQDQLAEIPANSPYRAQVVIETVGGIPSFAGYGGGSYTSTPFSGAATPMSPVAGPFGFAHGAESFAIPPGFPNDSFMAGFTSGEVLSVTPAGGNTASGEKVVNNNYFTITGIVDEKMVNYLTQEVTRVQAGK